MRRRQDGTSCYLYTTSNDSGYATPCRDSFGTTDACRNGAKRTNRGYDLGGSMNDASGFVHDMCHRVVSANDVSPKRHPHWIESVDRVPIDVRIWSSCLIY